MLCRTDRAVMTDRTSFFILFNSFPREKLMEMTRRTIEAKRNGYIQSASKMIIKTTMEGTVTISAIEVISGPEIESGSIDLLKDVITIKIDTKDNKSPTSTLDAMEICNEDKKPSKSLIFKRPINISKNIGTVEAHIEKRKFL